MALLSTIFKIPVKAQIGFLKLDASITENHSRSAQLSKNEVEDGAIISDHVNLDPETFSITGEISEVPVSILGLGVSTDDFLGAANDFLDGDKSAFEGLVKNERRTPKEAWTYLNQLMKNRTPFSVVTSLERYENVILTSLSAPRESKNGKNLVFTGQFEKVRIVKSSVVKIPAFKIKGDAANSASSKAGLGKQATNEATNAQESNASILFKGFKKIGVL